MPPGNLTPKKKVVFVSPVTRVHQETGLTYCPGSKRILVGSDKASGVESWYGIIHRSTSPKSCIWDSKIFGAEHSKGLEQTDFAGMLSHIPKSGTKWQKSAYEQFKAIWEMIFGDCNDPKTFDVDAEVEDSPTTTPSNGDVPVTTPTRKVDPMAARCRLDPLQFVGDVKGEVPDNLLPIIKNAFEERYNLQIDMASLKSICLNMWLSKTSSYEEVPAFWVWVQSSRTPALRKGKKKGVKRPRAFSRGETEDKKRRQGEITSDLGKLKLPASLASVHTFAFTLMKDEVAKRCAQLMAGVKQPGFPLDDIVAKVRARVTADQNNRVASGYLLG